MLYIWKWYSMLDIIKNKLKNMPCFCGRFKIFYLSLLLHNLIVMCLSVVFMLLVLRFCWASCTYGIIVVIQFGKNWGYYVFKCFIDPYLLTHSSRDSKCIFMRLLEIVPQLSDVLLIYWNISVLSVFNFG